MGKMSLMEATRLALCGELIVEDKEATRAHREVARPRQVKTESVEIATDDTVVSVDDSKTEIVTDEQTITVEKQPEESVEAPIEDVLPEETEEDVAKEDAEVEVDDIPVDDITAAVEEVKVEESKEVKTEDVDIHVDSESGDVTVATDEEIAIATEVAEEEPVKEVAKEEVVEVPVEEIAEEVAEELEQPTEEVVEEGCKKEETEEKLEESRGSRSEKLLELCEEGFYSWETIARELIAEMSEDDLEYTFRMLEIKDDEEDEEDEDEEEELEESCKKEEAKEKLNFLTVDELPDMCYGLLPSDNSIIVIKRNENGYYETDYDIPENEEAAEKLVTKLNDQLGVTPDQRFTMELRSLSGNWKN